MVLLFGTAKRNLWYFHNQKMLEIKYLPHDPDFKHRLKGNLFKTLWEKGENAGYQRFLLFSTMFSTLPKHKF